MPNKKGSLYLVPTPIGNLSDFTARAIETLKKAAIVACEDTRVSGRLFKHFDISAHKISYHDFNEQQRLPQLLETLENGGDVAVVSDAGSPGLSDPAYRIIRACIDNNIKIVPLPGPTALVPALTGSGLPLDRFFFEGFLPNKSGARKTRFEKLLVLEHTLVFYESPHRIGKSVNDALEILGDRPACIAREISKIHEEYIRGSLSELKSVCAERTLKGEIVFLIAGLRYSDKMSKSGDK